MGTFELTFKIYHLLKQKNYTIIQLHERLLAEKKDISIRTLYRKVMAIQEALIDTNEFLDIEIDARNVNNYSVKTNSKNYNLKNSDWIDYINSVVIFKNNFNIKKDSFIHNMFLNSIHNDAPLKSLLVSLLNEQLDFYQTTNFGELILTKKLKKNLFKFIYYYTRKCVVSIQNYSDSVKNNSRIPSLNEPLIPIKIVYHRENYNLILYAINTSTTYSLELDMIDNLSYVAAPTNSNFPEKVLQNISNYSFGYHPSFDDTVYDIKLVFPSNPGEHVINRFWHKSQKHKRLEDGSIEFYLTCKIDIELLGWIMMWMDNVKIIEPQLLKELYLNRLQNIEIIYHENKLPNNNG